VTATATGVVDSSVRVADFLARTTYDDLPAVVVADAKAAILDTIACALLGSANPELRPIREYAALAQAAPVSTVLGAGGLRTSPELAVLCNAAAVHQFDFDDTFDEAPCHPSSASVMTSLALAERSAGISGRQWITAVALGNEVTCRISRAITGKAHDFPWFRAPVVGIFGATAAGGVVLRSDASQHLQALGLTLPMVGGTFASLEYPGSDVRSMRDGIAYRNGVVAAQLARQGLRGDQHVFDGSFGFFHAFFGGRYRPEVLTEGLGTDYHRVSLKPWPSIRHVHTALTALREIMDRCNLHEPEIARVVVRVGATTRQRCGPVPRGGLPGTRMDLLGNLPFAVANMLMHGDVPVAAYRDNAVADRVIDLLERKVVTEFDPALTGSGTFERAHVAITTSGGAVHSAQCEHALGHPANPMSADQRRAKFSACAAGALSPLDAERIAAIIHGIERLEDVADVAHLAHLLA